MPGDYVGLFKVQYHDPAKGGTATADIFPTWWGYPGNGAAENDMWFVKSPTEKRSYISATTIMYEYFGTGISGDFPLTSEAKVDDQFQYALFFLPGKEFYFWSSALYGWSTCVDSTEQAALDGPCSVVLADNDGQ